jgi:3-oxoacyl-[acyl-carrier protein] reductase
LTVWTTHPAVAQLGAKLQDGGMDLGLKDRVYIVTGGSRGLGRATAQALVDDGAKVVVSSRREDNVEAAAAELGDSAVGVAADNAAEDTPARLVAAAKERFGRLDGALVSVGGPPAGTIMDTADDQWRTSFDSVFLGAVRLARAVADAVGDGGSIAFVLSTSVKAPLTNLAISNGLRPGLAMVAKTLADELGPQGIRVNGLMPGSIETERIQELNAAAPDPKAARAHAEEAIPLRRYGTPEEFGRAAAFVLSPAASYISGVALAIDGGVTRGL